MSIAWLHKWAVVAPMDPYVAPELKEQRLHGEVHHDSRFENGTKVTTTPIRGKTKLDHIVTLSGSVYALGEIDPKYKAQYPNARARLLSSLEVVK